MMMMMSSASSSSATVRVDKATSDLLINPDWAMNIDICDYINSYPGQAREFIKAVKRRLQHRNPKVQFLALTLLETMVKNCGDYIHFQIAEKNIPAEMVKIVKKKADMQVRDKILGLLDIWQEAFGGPGGKHPQYYYAYEELRRSGVQFPRRSPDAAPIFTPPVTRPTLMQTQAGYGMPSNSSRRLDEAMAAEIEGLSMSTIDSMRDVMDLLSDMLQAVNPKDRDAVKDEVIVDLVVRCQSNQRKLMQMLTTTGDEDLLARGLELNDSMQIVLAKHDAIASGSPLPSQTTNPGPKPTESRGPITGEKEVKKENGLSMNGSASNASAPPLTVKRTVFEEEEEEDDDFAQLARRHSKSPVSTSPSMGGNASPGPIKPDPASSTSSPSTPSTSRALVLPDPLAPVKTTSKDQDMIDLLSLALTTTTTSSSSSPHTPPPTNQSTAPNTNNSTQPPQPYSVPQSQVPSYNSYVVPWAQPQNPPQPPPQQLRPQYTQPVPPQRVQPQYTQASPQPVPPQRVQPQYTQASPQPVPPQRVQPQYTQASPQRYIPPPWAATPGYLNSGSSSNNSAFWTPRAETGGPANTPFQETKPLQHFNSFPARGMNNGPAVPPVDPRQAVSSSSNGQRPFVPSYRLFEDLNVLGKTSAPSGLSGNTGQSMIGGRR